MPSLRNSTPEDLELLAQTLLMEAPCAVEMPAGTGKTHLLAKIVSSAASEDKRCLVLTHTNAGVDALRKRMKSMGVPSSRYRVDTITGFAFALARAYTEIGGVTVPKTPDWTASNSYVDGAIRVTKAQAIKRMLTSSYDYFLIDEYQDCSMKHHDLITTIAESIPKCIVLGDRLQGIFDFGDTVLVDWEVDVFSRFSEVSVAHTPHRWKDVNPDMGHWLQEIRDEMVIGNTIDLTEINVPGVEWIQAGTGVLADLAFSFTDSTDTVLLLDKWANDVARHASMLGGYFSVMENIRGSFMIEWLDNIPESGNAEIAYWFVGFAKKCMTGLANIDAPILRKLENGESIAHYNREGLEDVLVILDNLRQNPSYTTLLGAADALQQHSETRLYRWEAWRDTIAAIKASIDGSTIPVDELSVIRDRIRHTGRRAHSRVASRTVLVKGLEYDHVIIADVAGISDPKNLYVALTRAKKSIYIISSNPIITLRSS